MTIQQEYLLRHNSIEELLDNMTTEKATGKLEFKSYGSGLLDHEKYYVMKTQT